MKLPKFPEGTTNHLINRKRENKILVSTWDFGAISPLKERKHYVCNEHPAKMRPSLTRAILQIYGESPVLDPMAGIGTTLVEAMLLGMDAIGVEYEERFVKQANRNIEYIKKFFPNKKLGKAVCIKGDARDLSCLKNRKVKSILTSPPYFDSIKSVALGHQGPEKGGLKRQHLIAKQTEKMRRLFREKRFKRKGSFLHVANPSSMLNQIAGYGANPENIGNLKEYGVFGSIVFSPPYFNLVKAGQEGPNFYNLRARELRELREKDPEKYREFIRKCGYSEDKENIGNLNRFGSVIFSPPYMDSIPFADKDFALNNRKVRDTRNCDYGDNPRNLGKKKGKTYLGEMFKVYRECYRVLKPGKFMIVVVKDIRRKGLTIPLACDTIKLIQLVGFQIFDIIVNRIHLPSFWALNNAIKIQSKGIPLSLKDYEWVIVAKKPEHVGN